MYFLSVMSDIIYIHQDMSDPFADLLSTFKGDNESPSNALNKENSPISTGTPHTGAATPLSLENDFDDLFGVKKPSEVLKPAKDDFDAAFDVFNTPAQSVSPQPASEVEQKQEQNEPIVDEVKDMEIARLMSLGISWKRATDYYERGTMYEDLVSRQKERHQRVKGNLDLSSSRDNSYIPKSLDQTSDQPDLFSVASSWINKGRDFIDSKLKQAQDDYSSHSFSDYISSRQSSQVPPAWLNERNRFVNSNKSSVKPATAELDHIDLLSDESDASGNFQNKARLSNGFVDNSNNEPVNKSSSVSVEPSSIPSDLVATSKHDETSPAPSQDLPEQNLLIDFDASEKLSPAQTAACASKSTISELELHGYREFNAKGTKAFTDGDYSTAFENYTKSLNTLPTNHPLRVIALSNIIISQLKLGENKQALKNVAVSLEFIHEDALDDTIQDSLPPKSFREFWSKIITRKAEALEHIEDYEGAFQAYQSLIKKGVVSGKIMEGKRRCQKVIEPEKFKPAKSKSESKSNLESSVNTKASPKLAQVQNINRKKEEEELQKFKLRDPVDLRIQEWSKGYENDLRQLLARLSQVLDWCNWKPVTGADLVIPKKAKIVYLKAVSKTHPDKIQESWTLEHKMIAENVFVVLNRAWELFKEENGMN